MQFQSECCPQALLGDNGLSRLSNSSSSIGVWFGNIMLVKAYPYLPSLLILNQKMPGMSSRSLLCTVFGLVESEGTFYIF